MTETFHAWCRKLGFAAAGAGFLLCTLGASAQNIQDDPGFRELMKARQAMMPRPSSDTTPLEFSLGSVHYKVPRNYIIAMDNFKGGPQTLVAFRITFPGFEPFSEETKDCLTLAPLDRPKGCMPLTFNINIGTAVSDEEAYNNVKRGARKVVPNDNVYGFDMYEIGVDPARTEVYGKQTPEHFLHIECMIIGGKKDSPICTNDARLPSQNGIHYLLNGNHYFLNGDQLKYAELIDDKLRKLVGSFTLIGEQE